MRNGTQWCPHEAHTASKSEGAWKVIWKENGKRYFKWFKGEKPRDSGAIDFGKKLQARGLTVDIVAGRPFRRPYAVKVPHGSLWCCYCLKIRVFVFKALRFPDGTRTPGVYRCPVCHMSIRDAAIRDNNDMVMIALLDPRAREKRKKVPTEKMIRRTLAQR